jgi:four helix bundle protein
MQDFRKLMVWRRAYAFGVVVHRVSAAIPRRDNAGVVSQLRRAALSISANIAEGCGRESNKDLARFLQIAIGSASETESHLQFCVDAVLIPKADFDRAHSEVVEIRRMLIGLLQKVRAAPTRPLPPTQN